MKKAEVKKEYENLKKEYLLKLKKLQRHDKAAKRKKHLKQKLSEMAAEVDGGSELSEGGVSTSKGQAQKLTFAEPLVRTVNEDKSYSYASVPEESVSSSFFPSKLLSSDSNISFQDPVLKPLRCEGSPPVLLKRDKAKDGQHDGSYRVMRCCSPATSMSDCSTNKNDADSAVSTKCKEALEKLRHCEAPRSGEDKFSVPGAEIQRSVEKEVDSPRECMSSGNLSQASSHSSAKESGSSVVSESSQCSIRRRGRRGRKRKHLVKSPDVDSLVSRKVESTGCVVSKSQGGSSKEDTYSETCQEVCDLVPGLALPKDSPNFERIKSIENRPGKKSTEMLAIQSDKMLTFSNVSSFSNSTSCPATFPSEKVNSEVRNLNKSGSFQKADMLLGELIKPITPEGPECRYPKTPSSDELYVGDGGEISDMISTQETLFGSSQEDNDDVLDSLHGSDNMDRNGPDQESVSQCQDDNSVSSLRICVLNNLLCTKNQVSIGSKLIVQSSHADECSQSNIIGVNALEEEDRGPGEPVYASTDVEESLCLLPMITNLPVLNQTLDFALPDLEFGGLKLHKLQRYTESSHDSRTQYVSKSESESSSRSYSNSEEGGPNRVSKETSEDSGSLKANLTDVSVPSICCQSSQCAIDSYKASMIPKSSDETFASTCMNLDHHLEARTPTPKSPVLSLLGCFVVSDSVPISSDVDAVTCNMTFDGEEEVPYIVVCSGREVKVLLGCHGYQKWDVACQWILKEDMSVSSVVTFPNKGIIALVCVCESSETIVARLLTFDIWGKKLKCLGDVYKITRRKASESVVCHPHSERDLVISTDYSDVHSIRMMTFNEDYTSVITQVIFVAAPEMLTSLHPIQSQPSVVLGTGKSSVYLWNIKDGALLATFNLPLISPIHSCIAVYEEEGLLFLPLWINEVTQDVVSMVILNPASGKSTSMEYERYESKIGRLSSVCVSADSQLFGLHVSGNITVWDIFSGCVIGSLEAGGVQSISAIKNSDVFFTVAKSRRTCVHFYRRTQQKSM